MKRTISETPIILSVLYAFVPLCHAIGAAFGYDFILSSDAITIVVLTVVSLVLTALFLFYKVTLNKTNAVFAALSLPLSVINGFFFFPSDWAETGIFVLLCCGCAAILLFKAARPKALKVVSAVISYLLIFLLIIFFFFTFGINATVNPVVSPQKTYTALVIKTDQRFLGGCTSVEVANTKEGINLLIFQFSKSPTLVYRGDGSEFENMKISWKDEHTLIINNREYDIRD